MALLCLAAERVKETITENEWVGVLEVARIRVRSNVKGPVDPVRAVWHWTRDQLALGLGLPLTPKEKPAPLRWSVGRPYVAPLHLKELPAVFASIPGLQAPVDYMLQAGVNELNEAAGQAIHVTSPE